MKEMFMKKIGIIGLFLLSAVVAMAMPVKRGQWTTITLANGQTVRVEARGDEWMHFWQAEDGVCYAPNLTSGAYEVTTKTQLASRAKARKGLAIAAAKQNAMAKRAPGTQTSPYIGKKRGLIILVQFPNQSFQTTGAKALYTRIANEPGYSEGSFNGSVHDYFHAQSGGLFDLDFDVVGPITMPNTYSYYGLNDEEKMGELVHDACVAVNDSVNFATYDWDDDRTAEEVFILYAGYGQADHYSNDNYIYPHMFELQGYDYYAGKHLVLDGTEINIYACANELTASNSLNGIGTICHEFSHCLGLPDMYDTGSNDNFGMGSWDLMDYGCYNGDSYTPAGYTGYEKMVCGWTEPVELSADTTITGMKALNKNGTSYIVYNPANRNEYYLLDNRQRQGFDAYLPGHGLLVTHVDYNDTVWEYNTVNNTGLDTLSGFNNAHQRATIFHADNRSDFYSQVGDAYPYRGNDSLTVASTPKSFFYNTTSSGSQPAEVSILHISEQADSTISFGFKMALASASGGNGPADGTGTVLLKETFDQCAGSGGNDGVFSGNVASSSFVPDLTGWTDYAAAYGGKQCARFGKSSAGTGTVTTPWFTLPGDTVTLSFRAAGWNASGDGTDLLLSLTGGNAKFVTTQTTDQLLTMVKGQWTSYELKLVGTGQTCITFSPSRRFFLDDVLVERPVVLAIRPMVISGKALLQDDAYYTLDGRKAGTNWNALPRGIYIHQGRKLVK